MTDANPTNPRQTDEDRELIEWLRMRKADPMSEQLDELCVHAATRLESLLSDKAKLEERVRVLEEALQCAKEYLRGELNVAAVSMIQSIEQGAALNNKSGQSSTRGGASPEPGHMGEDG